MEDSHGMYKTVVTHTTQSRPCKTVMAPVRFWLEGARCTETGSRRGAILRRASAARQLEAKIKLVDSSAYLVRIAYVLRLNANLLRLGRCVFVSSNLPRQGRGWARFSGFAFAARPLEAYILHF